MLTITANVVVFLVAALHVYILALEMFFWDKPLGRKAFGLSADFAAQTKTLAANQGLYNGFLAAGLFWGLALGPWPGWVLHQSLLPALRVRRWGLRRPDGEQEDSPHSSRSRRAGSRSAVPGCVIDCAQP